MNKNIYVILLNKNIMTANQPSMAWPRVFMTSVICNAISRVGAKMTACSVAILGCTISKAATANTQVFPVPAFDCTIKSEKKQQFVKMLCH